MTQAKQRKPIDVALELVADRKRRKALRYFLEAEREVVSVDDLAAAITDGDTQLKREVNECKHRARISLRHHHLPKLAEANVIDYDVSSEMIRYQPHKRLENLLNYISTEVDEAGDWDLGPTN